MFELLKVMFFRLYKFKFMCFINYMIYVIIQSMKIIYKYNVFLFLIINMFFLLLMIKNKLLILNIKYRLIISILKRF